MEEINYEEFVYQFVAELQLKLSPYDMQVSIVNKMRNNGILEKSIKVDIPGTNVSPSISTLPLYEHCCDCDDMPAVVKALAEKIIAERDRQIDTMSVLSKDNILNSTYLMVVNTASNKALLADTPHFLIAEGELAAIPRLSINIGGKKGSIIIKNGMLPVLQMTGEEILRVGKNNMVEQNLFEINSLLAETMRLMDEKGEDISDDFSEFFVENNPKTFVITTKDKKLGACCLACPEVIGTAIDKMGFDCYILPSSIHEVILVEKKGNANEIEELRDMVNQVNRQSVPANEILSDQVFQYNSKTRKIEIAHTEQELKEMPEAPHKNRGLHM